MYKKTRYMGRNLVLNNLLMTADLARHSHKFVIFDPFIKLQKGALKVKLNQMFRHAYAFHTKKKIIFNTVFIQGVHR